MKMNIDFVIYIYAYYPVAPPYIVEYWKMDGSVSFVCVHRRKSKIQLSVVWMYKRKYIHNKYNAGSVQIQMYIHK